MQTGGRASPSEVARALAGNEGGESAGPHQLFEAVGRDALLTLVEAGLDPSRRLLDFGCGVLRLGYWLIRFLDPDRYCGIEPKRERVELGKRFALTPELLTFKAPRFAYNSDCDMSVFGERFDFVVARSIFSHTAPGLLRASLASFRESSADGAVMLASYWRASGPHALEGGTLGDQLGDDDQRFMWLVKYSLPRIAELAEGVGLRVTELTTRPPLNRQIWLRFEAS
jgi:hypothetical protein